MVISLRRFGCRRAGARFQNREQLANERPRRHGRPASLEMVSMAAQFGDKIVVRAPQQPGMLRQIAREIEAADDRDLARQRLVGASAQVQRQPQCPVDLFGALEPLLGCRDLGWRAPFAVSSAASSARRELDLALRLDRGRALRWPARFMEIVAWVGSPGSGVAMRHAMTMRPAFGFAGGAVHVLFPAINASFDDEQIALRATNAAHFDCGRGETRYRRSWRPAAVNDIVTVEVI
jgi:hypothetical protein